MGLDQNSCPGCGKRGGMTKLSEFDGQKLPGSFCKKCGLFTADKQSERFDVSCEGCGKQMAQASAQVPVIHMRSILGKDDKVKERQITVIHKGEQRKRYMCPDCSRKRVEKGEHDIDEVLTRFPVNCLNCGTLLAYNDHPEGYEDINQTRAHCKSCTPKATEVAENNNALDSIVKDVSGVP